MIKIGLVPIIASVLVYSLFKIEKLKNINYWTKQIICGVLFGGVAVIGTEFGVPLNGALMNTRDAAALSAGLIFGGPAGVIAGLIGGIERWFAVYWGAGEYTRLACTISTCLVGLAGAVLKEYMFEDRIPTWQYSLAMGIACETLHMMMIFITNYSDAKQAFNVVKACTIPMVSVNALSVTFAVLAIRLIDHKELLKESKKKLLSEQFLRGLLILIFTAFILTSSFTFFFHTKMSQSNTSNLLQKNIQDIINDVDSKSNKNLIDVSRRVSWEIEEAGEVTNEYLIELSEKYKVAEINIVDKDGIIVNSTYEPFIGYDMNDGEQSKDFLALIANKNEVVQPYQHISFDTSIQRKYAGIVLDEGGFVQVGYNAEEFQEDIADEVKDVATYRHIEDNGGLIIVDSNNVIVSDSFGYSGTSLKNIDIDEYEESVVHRANFNNSDYYFMYNSAEGYKIIAILPVAEADLTKEISIYLNLFMEIIVFAGLCILTYFLIKMLVVDNVKEVDNSLQKITDGNLDTVVDVRTNDEFNSLSNGINTTVDSMKKLISEANKRIDDELQYAKDIQFSSLPSIFPPYPSRDDFDIYALMDPAKEVGGDFYDFYLLNNNVMAFLVADVAGKGIPAALFMMRSKSIIKTYAEAGISVADIFTNANFNLCEGNDAGMFVTAWMGFLNLETGELKYANAGHNRPLIRRKGGEYEYLKGPAGFVLGGMEGIAYKEQTLQLEPGDEIFLYTDGVPEATNKYKELFNDMRLQDAINKYKDNDAQQLCLSLKETVDGFYKGAPQFDDITMLSLKYKKRFDWK